MATPRLCSISGCDKPFVAKGYCRMHYMRVYTKGNPHREPTIKQKMFEFVENVALPYEGTDCLEHPFKKTKGGYYIFRLDGLAISLHRYICQRKHGPAPGDNYDAAHECGHGWCANGNHLFWKTRVDNMLDKKRHGTWLEGETAHQAILTEEQVREIRALVATMQQKEIAKLYGVHKNTIWHIVHGNTWKHVA